MPERDADEAAAQGAAPLSQTELAIIDRHARVAGMASKERVPQHADRHSVYNPRTGRLHVHKADRRKSAEQQHVFESSRIGVANTLTSAHPLKFWDLRRRATPRETARLQGFPDGFALPRAAANALFAKAVSVPVAAYAVRCAAEGAAHPVRTFVDVCAGIGGFHLGATRAVAALRCVGFSEICPRATRCYEANFPEAPALGSLFDARWPACDLVCMGFPCQPFSRCTQSTSREAHRDRHVCEALPAILDATGAHVVVLENVRSILTLGKEQLAFLAAAFDARGFAWTYRVLDSSEFELPQTRKRLYILASRTHAPVWIARAPRHARLCDILEGAAQAGGPQAGQAGGGAHTAVDEEGVTVAMQMGAHTAVDEERATVAMD